MIASIVRRRALALGALLWMGACALSFQPPPAYGFQTESPAAELGKIKSLAESQHEIVMILIRKKDFSRAVQEAAKIFEMKWPVDQEPLLSRELRYLSEQLVNNAQHAAALQLLDSNSGSFRSAAGKAAVWKEKGYVHKKMGQDDKAMECFREAQRLEKAP